MIAACVKWVAGVPEPGDERFAGISAADQAAVELALRHGASMGDDVVVVTAGPPAAERALREALAAGATRAVRVDLPADATSSDVATALAGVVGDAAFVWCGDYSTDRGSGSVPAFLAAERSARQALGAVAVDLADGATISVTRRLDGGRREVSTVSAPAVVSVEGAVARLRRAGLAGVLAARTAPIEVRRPAVVVPDVAAIVHAYRPRARTLPPPHGSTLDRLRELTDAAAAPAHGETVHLDPADAADRILTALRAWSYLT
ncbi:MAG: Electron transfer flavoprotein alpha/beta-subunit [Ilumatobacteraceae bacterium]|nr:Electron transfer flavoprotein alpha/beta-subunit [Ilumatobacteraceae bacterium]